MIRRPDLDDLDREIRDHIEAETLENIERGMPEVDARAAAWRTFGNPTRIKEDVRDVWIWAWADRLRQDARDVSRRFRRSPGFALTVSLTLALGIGLTTAVFSVVNAVLLRPLSYSHPDRMVWLTTRDAGSDRDMLNSFDFAMWKTQSTTFEHMVAYGFADETVIASGEASRWRVVAASDGFWAVTGAEPMLGRLPAARDGDVIVLSHRAFRDRFQSDPSVVGRAVTIGAEQVTIGAVLPAHFAPQLPEWAWRPGQDRPEIDAYRGLVPLTPAPSLAMNQTLALYLAIGQLEAGVSIAQARAEIDAIHARTQQETTALLGRSLAIVEPLQDRVVGSTRIALRLLLAAAISVLLITCVNVAHLLLSRSVARQKEIALRMSVGSGPLRVIRQLLVESAAYSFAGAAAGMLLAWWMIGAIIALMGPAVPRLTETTFDLRVFAFAIAAAIVTALAFGLYPALTLSRTNVQEVLKDGTRSATSSIRSRAAARSLVALQFAVTAVLVIAAGLMLRSVWQVTAYPQGFAPEQILTLRAQFGGPQYRETAARQRFVDALVTTARSLPGVLQAELTDGRGSLSLVIHEGQPRPENADAHAAPVSSVSPGMPAMWGMSLVRGRWLQETEPHRAILINEALARREFPGVDPIGRRIQEVWGDEEGRMATIVGVVSDVRYGKLDADAVPEIFVPYSGRRLFDVTLALRVDGDPMAAAPSIVKALAAVDPSQPLFSVKTLEQTLNDTIAPRRFNLLLLGTFAGVALLLVALGIYGVVAYGVAERTHEIGIRLAVGAERSQVVRMIVRQNLLGATGGLALGLALAPLAARLMATLLYDVEPTDAATFAVAAAVLTAIAFAACVLPARRAARVDPLRALRTE